MVGLKLYKMIKDRLSGRASLGEIHHETHSGVDRTFLESPSSTSILLGIDAAISASFLGNRNLGDISLGQVLIHV